MSEFIDKDHYYNYIPQVQEIYKIKYIKMTQIKLSYIKL